MIDPPLIHGGLVVRSLALVVGLFLFALGIVMQLEAELGLSPWDVLNQGISDRSTLSFGTANIAVALVVLVAAWSLGARVGPGTIANAILIGLFVDALLRVDAITRLSGQPLGVDLALTIGGILVIGLGSGLYIGAGLGAGPRDSLMLVGARRTGARIGAVRVALEVAVTVVGFVLGGMVGIGTLAFAFGIGPAVELGFGLLVLLGLARQSQPPVRSPAS
ncbi:MAG: YczE/YyaS/YitT family protein [Gaiella sp.]